MKDGKKKIIKKVFKHLDRDDKEFVGQIKDDKSLKKSLKKMK